MVEQTPPGPAGPRWSRWLGRFLARIVWNTHVVGVGNVPAQGPVLLVANHVSIIDGPIVHGVVRRGSHFLVKREFFESKLGFLMWWSGQIYTDRSQGRGALTNALAVLRRGGVVGIFPEGTRGDGRAESVRAGVGWLAANADATIVPVAVLGTRLPGHARGHIPRPRTKLVAEFGTGFHLTRPAGVSRREFVGIAAEEIRVRLAQHVASASTRHAIALPGRTPEAD